MASTTILMWTLSVGGRLDVEAALTYHVTDPYAVTIVFDNGVTWEIARQLLVDGLRRRVGDGDVQVRPAPADSRLFQLTLTSNSARLTLHGVRNELRSFLRETYKEVPLGGESDIALHELDIFLQHVYG